MGGFAFLTEIEDGDASSSLANSSEPVSVLRECDGLNRVTIIECGGEFRGFGVVEFNLTMGGSNSEQVAIRMELSTVDFYSESVRKFSEIWRAKGSSIPESVKV